MRLLLSVSTSDVFFYITVALIAVTMTVLVYTFVKVLRQTLKEKKKIEADLKAKKSVAEENKEDNEGFEPVFDKSDDKDKNQR